MSKLAGVSQQQVSRLITSETLPKWLEGLQGELLHSHLTNSYNSRATIVTAEEAALAYNNAISHRGEFAVLNQVSI